MPKTQRGRFVLSIARAGGRTEPALYARKLVLPRPVSSVCWPFMVGRIRKDLTSDNIWIWPVVDNLRKGAATDAVQIAELSSPETH